MFLVYVNIFCGSLLHFIIVCTRQSIEELSRKVTILPGDQIAPI